MRLVWRTHGARGKTSCPGLGIVGLLIPLTLAPLIAASTLPSSPLQDFPVQNSVCLLKRAAWFKERAERHTLPPEDGAAPRRERSWADEDAYDLCDDDDDDLEAFYFSSAAGRARVTLGNRRFGEGGYIASGRRQARPAPSSGKVRSGSSVHRGTLGGMLPPHTHTPRRSPCPQPPAT